MGLYDSSNSVENQGRTRVFNGWTGCVSQPCTTRCAELRPCHPTTCARSSNRVRTLTTISLPDRVLPWQL